MEFKTAKSIQFAIFIFSTIICRYISCVNFGYISPIEVVEEWGCHDTEIRLTCGSLDSSIAVLEATFTPNCTETLDGDDNCAHIDLKRLTRAYTSPLIDHQMAETEAGKKFLETMRRSKEIEAALNDSLVTNKIADVKHQNYVELKSKRNSLRSSLEELILEYLRGLSPPGDEENYMEFSKRIRKKREIYVNERNEHENKSDKLDLDTDSVNQRTEIGAMNITVVSDEDYDSDTKYDRYRSVSERSVCVDHRRRITQLDQFALDQSIEDEADDEHNIRRILNY
ncbi:hypothetical protein Bhyg_01313, partial [Pseudolycoriella hygida]